ncbi:hypothetical protein K8R47_00230, partial [archaeon]|nr:hypothetical protein [archaeon]
DLEGNTRANLLFFTVLGKQFQLVKVYDISLTETTRVAIKEINKLEGTNYVFDDGKKIQN